MYEHLYISTAFPFLNKTPGQTMQMVRGVGAKATVQFSCNVYNVGGDQ